MDRPGSNQLKKVKNVIDFQIFSLVTPSRCPLSYEDLYQIGYIGYLKAQKNYNPEYGPISLTYASQYIRQELISTLRKEYKYSNNARELNEQTTAESPDRYNPTTAPILQKIKAVLHNLTESQQHVIKSMYFDTEPKRLKDLAEERGVSKQRIHQIKTAAINKLQRLISNDL